jgi:hypothetical protein
MQTRLGATPALLICILGGGAFGATMLNTSPITPAGENYKDSFYFSWRGERFLALSDLDRGGLTILQDSGDDDRYDLLFERFPIPWAYAPQVYFISEDVCYIAFASIPNLDFQAAKLRFFRYDMASGHSGGLRDAPFHDPADNQRLIDPTIWREANGTWYLVAAQAEENPFGLRLVWSGMESPATGFGTPQPLTDQFGGPVDRWRNDIGDIAEAPIWSWWDHDGDGRHELYWSIGPSDPYVGNECHGEVQAVRRGNIHLQGGDLWIEVWDHAGGPGDWMGLNEDCYLFTHPDFTASGAMRATGHRLGPDGYFAIVQETAEGF